jgi:5-methylcytosine-specific restriction endonuclease McrA
MENLELDHIIPSSMGGPSTKENSQTLCKSCNTRKFNDEDWPAYLASLKKPQ